MTFGDIVLLLVQGWGILGGVTALVFLTWGIDRIDEDAQGAYVFRVLLIPGVLLIWPVVLWRWWQIEDGNQMWMARYTPVRAQHGRSVLVMGLAIVALVFAGLSVRQTWPDHIAPQQLEAGQ